MNDNLNIKLRALRELKLSNEEAFEMYGVWTVESCTPKQRSFIYGLLEKVGMDFSDFNIDDAHDLTKLEASELIEELKDIRDGMSNRELW